MVKESQSGSVRIASLITEFFFLWATIWKSTVNISRNGICSILHQLKKPSGWQRLCSQWIINTYHVLSVKTRWQSSGFEVIDSATRLSWLPTKLSIQLRRLTPKSTHDNKERTVLAALQAVYDFKTYQREQWLRAYLWTFVAYLICHFCTVMSFKVGATIPLAWVNCRSSK